MCIRFCLQGKKIQSLRTRLKFIIVVNVSTFTLNKPANSLHLSSEDNSKEVSGEWLINLIMVGEKTLRYFCGQ